MFCGSTGAKKQAFCFVGADTPYGLPRGFEMAPAFLSGSQNRKDPTVRTVLVVAYVGGPSCNDLSALIPNHDL